MEKNLNRKTMTKRLTVLGALFCIAIMLGPSLNVSGTSNVDIFIDNGELMVTDYEMDIFGTVIFAINPTGMQNDYYFLIRITEGTTDSDVMTWHDEGIHSTLGKLNPSADVNLLIVPLTYNPTNPTAKHYVQLTATGGTDFQFGLVDPGPAPQSTDLYTGANGFFNIEEYTQVIGYPLPQQTDYSISILAKQDLSKGYNLEIKGEDIGAEALNYVFSSSTGTFYDNGLTSVDEEKVHYIQADFTSIKLHSLQQKKFELVFTPCQPLPVAASSGDVYYDDTDEKIHISLAPTSYNTIVNSYEPFPVAGINLGSFVTSYEEDPMTMSVTTSSKSVDIKPYQTGLVIERNDDPGTYNQDFGQMYGADYTPITPDTTNYWPYSFQLLTGIEMVDWDGDGLPIITIYKKQVDIDVNGLTTITNIAPSIPSPCLICDTNDEDGRIPDSWRDFDDDGLGTVGEVHNFSTNPVSDDSDGDSMGDYFEINYWNELGKAYREDVVISWFQRTHGGWVHNDYIAVKSKTLLDYYQTGNADVRASRYLPNGDLDGDGIINVLDADADNDALKDGDEYEGITKSLMGGDASKVYTLPFNPDSDLDGAFDGEEMYSYFPVQSIKGEDLIESGSEYLNSEEESTQNYAIDYSPIIIEVPDPDPDHLLNFKVRPIYNGNHGIRLYIRGYTDDPSALEDPTPTKEVMDYLTVTLKDGATTVPSSNDFEIIELFYNDPDDPETNPPVVPVIGDNEDLKLENQNFQGSITYIFAEKDGEPNTFDLVANTLYDLQIEINEQTADGNPIEIVVDEVVLMQEGINPLKGDVDNDGLGDGNLTTIISGSTISVYEMGERILGTSPYKSDTDADGLQDGSSSGEVDVEDLENVATFTDPLNPDSDGDGMLDGISISKDSTQYPHLVNKLLRLGIESSNTGTLYDFVGEASKSSLDPNHFDSDEDGLLDGVSKQVEMGSDLYWQFMDANIVIDSTGGSTKTINTMILDKSTEYLSVPQTHPAYAQRSIELVTFYGEESISCGAIHLKPHWSDSDQDGMSDGWEKLHGFDPCSDTDGKDLGADVDNDGLDNIDEYHYPNTATYPIQIGTAGYWGGTDPNNPDSDDDGLVDGISSITISDSDTRYDDWADPTTSYDYNIYWEQADSTNRKFFGEKYHNNGYITSAVKPDSDTDGLPDLFETLLFDPQSTSKYDSNEKIFNPMDGTQSVNEEEVSEGELDHDYDGISNYDEFIYGRGLDDHYKTYQVWKNEEVDDTYVFHPLEPDSDGDLLIDGHSKFFVNEAANASAISYLEGEGILNTVDDLDTPGDTTDDEYTFYGEGYYGSDKFDTDTDDDGLWDGLDGSSEGEWNRGTYPTSVDSDNDGLLDGNSVSDSSYNSLECGSDCDWDEYIIHNDATDHYIGELSLTHNSQTPDPTNPDSDNDLLGDGFEYLANTQYNVSGYTGYATRYDVDEDWIPDGVEPQWEGDADNDDYPNFMDLASTDGTCDEFVRNTCQRDTSGSDWDKTFVNLRMSDLNWDTNTKIGIWYGQLDENNNNEPYMEEWIDGGSSSTSLPVGYYFFTQTPDGREVYRECVTEACADNQPSYQVKIYDEIDDEFDSWVINPGQFSIDLSLYPAKLPAKDLLEVYDWSNYLSNDDDIDGIDNTQENSGYIYQLWGEDRSITTSSQNPDYDGDGLLDGEDIVILRSKIAEDLAEQTPEWSSDWETIYFYDDLGDSVYFYGELTQGTHPQYADNDGDLVLDGFEVIINTDTNGDDPRLANWGTSYAYIDYEEDSVNYRKYYGELTFGTNPFSIDHDKDGLIDGPTRSFDVVQGGAYAEMYYEYNSITSKYDYLGEITLGTNATLLDSDGDGYEDRDELEGVASIKSGEPPTYILNPALADTDGDGIDDYTEINGWEIFLIDVDGTRTPTTVYGDPTALYTLGDNGNRISDQLKYESGGNPFSDDTDGDGIPDYYELDDSGEIGYSLFTPDGQSPQIDVRDITPSIEASLSWEPLKAYLDIKLYIQDISGIGQVQIRIDNPSKSSWNTLSLAECKKARPGVDGQPDTDDDICVAGIYRGSIKLSVANAALGAAYWFDLDIRAADLNGNVKHSETQFQGALGTAVTIATLVLDVIQDTASKIAEAVMDAINWVIDYVKDKIDGMLNAITEVINTIAESLKSAFNSLADAIQEINKFEIGRSSGDVGIVESHLNSMVEGILEKFDILFSLYSQVEPIIDVLMLFSYIVNPSMIITFILTTLLAQIGAIQNLIDSLLSKIGESVAIVLFSESGLFSLAGVEDKPVNTNDNQFFVSVSGIHGFLDTNGLREAISKNNFAKPYLDLIDGYYPPDTATKLFVLEGIFMLVSYYIIGKLTKGEPRQAGEGMTPVGRPQAEAGKALRSAIVVSFLLAICGMLIWMQTSEPIWGVALGIAGLLYFLGKIVHTGTKIDEAPKSGWLWLMVGIDFVVELLLVLWASASI